jgi:hypothetical protein
MMGYMYLCVTTLTQRVEDDKSFFGQFWLVLSPLKPWYRQSNPNLHWIRREL